MTITVYGVAGSMDTTHWARIARAQGDLQASHGIIEGLAVTTTATPRQVSIAAGRSLQAGTDLDSGAAVLKVGDANAGASPRLDYVCTQVDWAQPSATAGSMVIVKGVEAATPVPPALTRNEGVLWQEPIARYQMQGGVISGLVGLGAASAAVALPGAFWSIPATTGLRVERRNGLIFLGGRFTRTSTTFTDLADFSGEVIIPEGFRPTRPQNAWVTSDGSDPSTPTTAHLVIATNGTANLYVFAGSVATGQTIRVVDTSWIGA